MEGADRQGAMRRHGYPAAPQLSPLSSFLGQDGVPNVTDDSYEYIRSDDLLQRPYDNQQPLYDYSIRGSRSGGSYFRPPDDDDGIPQDDVLLLRHGLRIDREFFPAFSIGDGKLYAGDVRDRVQLIYNLSDADRDNVKLYYKGTPLDNDGELVCKNGVKNNSEIRIVLPGDEREDFSNGMPRSPTGRSARMPRPRSPRQSGPFASTGNLAVPPRGRPDNRGGSSSRAHSAASVTSGVSGMSSLSNMTPPRLVSGSPMEKLNSIAAHFENNLLPLCHEFIAQPPADEKKRTDDHRKISETIMQHVLLKLDEVDTGGDEAVRARRKALVNQVQSALKEMDKILASSA